METQFSVVGHWRGDFDEGSLRQWAVGLRSRLNAPRVSLGLVFIGPRLMSQAAAVLELLRVHAQIPLLAGCSSAALIAGDEEIEHDPGLVLGLFALPDVELRGYHFTSDQVQTAGEASYWPSTLGAKSEGLNGWLVFSDPFQTDCDAWLRSWNASYAPLPVLGGLASSGLADHSAQVYLDGEVHTSGGVAISFGGDVRIASIISQGCTPIGETWTITKVEQNVIHRIGNRPAYQVLLETFNQLTLEQQRQARGNLFIGLVVNEYLEDFNRGDFLVRNLIGADPKSGCIAVGALPRAGQTLQFQRRDGQAADEDMVALLGRAQAGLAGTPVYGGCLCSCNGRGSSLFGTPSHDARLVQSHFGPLGVAGFFCNGEIGPVGDRNFLHGYTASVALFVRK